MNTSPSEDEGRDEAPSFTPTVEGGVLPLEEVIPDFPSNYFLVVDIRHVFIGYIEIMVQNLTIDGIRVFGSGNFQLWLNPVSVCIRVSCNKANMERYLKVAKETARIWGASGNSFTLYHSAYPEAV
jgi:hypothetical protein